MYLNILHATSKLPLIWGWFMHVLVCASTKTDWSGYVFLFVIHFWSYSNTILVIVYWSCETAQNKQILNILADIHNFLTKSKPPCIFLEICVNYLFFIKTIFYGFLDVSPQENNFFDIIINPDILYKSKCSHLKGLNLKLKNSNTNKTWLQEVSRHVAQNVSKKAWRAKFTLIKHKIEPV